jgi:Family of unknown function (DUF6065)
VSDKPNTQGRPLIGFITRDDAPPIHPAPITRTWMSEMHQSWPNRCLPILIANQSGWEIRNPCAIHRYVDGPGRPHGRDDRTR